MRLNTFRFIGIFLRYSMFHGHCDMEIDIDIDVNLQLQLNHGCRKQLDWRNLTYSAPKSIHQNGINEEKI